jgi:RecA-family ATPase
LFRLYSFAEVLAEADGVPPFVVDGLISESATMLLGDPKVGKSFLVASLAQALSAGSPEWLGRKVYGGRRGVVIATTDPGNHREYIRRLSALGVADGSGVTVVSMDEKPVDTARWYRDARAVLNMHQASVLVLDNVMGAMPSGHSINDPASAKLLTDPLTRLTNDGTAVITVHHHGKAFAGPKSGMGSQMFTAWPRLILALEPEAGKGKRRDARLLRVKGNDVMEETVRLRLIDDAEGGVSYVLDDREPRERDVHEKGEARQSQEEVLAAFVLDTPELKTAGSKAEAAKTLEQMRVDGRLPAGCKASTTLAGWTQLLGRCNGIEYVKGSGFVAKGTT